MWLAVLVALAIISVYLLEHLHVAGMPPTFWKESLIFLGASFMLIYLYLKKAGKGAFLQLYLATMVVKLLAFGGYNIWVILEDSEHAPANVIFFLIIHVSLTVWEVLVLFPQPKR